MMKAYDELYLPLAQKSLARMIDYAVYALNMPLKKFWKKFLKSNYSELFETGDSTILAGMSGVELAYAVLNIEPEQIKYNSLYRSEEYWLGYYLAYFQWKYGFTFKEIELFYPIDDMIRLYNPYHEADVEKFCSVLVDAYCNYKKHTKIKAFRLCSELTQKELAEKSGTPLRTLQQYEQGRKDICHASAIYVVGIAKVLDIDPWDLFSPFPKRK